MRKLTFPGASFIGAAYAGPQRLVSIEWRKGGAPWHLWDLAGGRPEDVDWLRRRVVWNLFKPGGAHYLRSRGLWPDGEALPPTAHSGPIDNNPLLDPPSLLWSVAAFGPDGASVLYCEQVVIEGYNSARFHLRAADGSLREVFHASCILGSPADFSRDGTLIAMSGGSRSAAVWSTAENRVIAELKQSDGVNQLAFAADGRLAVAAGRTVRLWDASTGELLHKFRSFRKFARALAVSPDGRLIAAGGGGVVCVWDAASGAEVANYDWDVGEIKSLAFSPDGATAAAAGEKAVVVWDVD